MTPRCRRCSGTRRCLWACGAALLGGFRNFAGPLVGGIVFTYLKTYAVATTEYWQLLLGIVLVTLVLVLPTGIVGALSRGWQRLQERRAAP